MNTLAMTINPASTSESIIQLASGKSLAIVSGTITPTGLANTTIYVDGEAGSTVTADYHRIVVTFDDVACTDVQIGYDGSNYFDGIIGNVQLWDATFDANDVEYDYLNCYQNLTAVNRPGTSLTSANLKGHWPLIEGSGDVAYDHSGNGNHGTLTNFPTDDSQWSNASALDSPLAIQTALTDWNYLNSVVRPIGTSGGKDYIRYNGLNFNKISTAAAPNGASPDGSLVIELCVKDNGLSTDQADYLTKYSSYRVLRVAGAETPKLYIYQASGNSGINMMTHIVDGGYFHIVCAFNRTTGDISYVVNGSYLHTASAYIEDINNDPTRPLTIGGAIEAYPTLNGIVNYVKIYQGVTADEIIADLLLWSVRKASKALMGICRSTTYTLGLGIGDSFADAESEWPFRLNSRIEAGIFGRGYAGKTLDFINSSHFQSDLALAPFDFTVIQGGINDIRSDCTSAELETTMVAMIEYCNANGINPVCVNVSPFKNHVDWTTARQSVLETYNAWLSSYCSTHSIPLANIYTALDVDSNDTLDSIYDSGDHLHPNQAGSIKIAETIKTAMGL